MPSIEELIDWLASVEVKSEAEATNKEMILQILDQVKENMI